VQQRRKSIHNPIEVQEIGKSAIETLLRKTIRKKKKVVDTHPHQKRMNKTLLTGGFNIYLHEQFP